MSKSAGCILAIAAFVMTVEQTAVAQAVKPLGSARCGQDPPHQRSEGRRAGMGQAADIPESERRGYAFALDFFGGVMAYRTRQIDGIAVGLSPDYSDEEALAGDVAPETPSSSERYRAVCDPHDI